jgi:serine/threonine protein kinase/CHAT domain-containing protein/Tfp pilus assembly protein PilF
MGAERQTCPSPRVLERLLAEQLNAQERDSVETHVEFCGDCQTRLQNMVPSGQQQVVPSEENRDESDPEPGEEFMSRLRQIVPPASPPGASVESDLIDDRWPTLPGSPAAAREFLGGDAARQEGARLGQYEILGKLGNGSMGVVFKARHTELDKVVALKVLKGEHADEVTIARFKNEIRAVGRLEHPNIVVAHDAGELDGIHYLVMEYVDGMDLARLVERCDRLSAADACEVIRQAAVGLQHAYERGLVHRDIKPSNLMLARDGRVRLLDLGLARSFGEAPSDTLTAAGMMLGTADYLAPEQWDHPHEADTRADIYSLGCTLYHLLAGKAPFSNETYRSVLNKMVAHVKVPPPPIKELCPKIPPSLDAVVNRMLAKNPANRFARPSEVAEALLPFTAGSDLAGLLKTAEGGKGKEQKTEDVGRETKKARSQISSIFHPRSYIFIIGSLLLVIGLLGIAAAIFGPRFWHSPVTNPAPPPLQIEEFRVNHLQGKQAKDLGDIRNSAEEIKVNDSVRVYARLSAPAYCYLIAFNPDGTEQLCHPAWEGERPEAARAMRPEPVTEVRFFPNDKDVFALDSGGLQVFVLVTSTQPLPPYAEWRSGIAKIPWKVVSHGGQWRWQFDGRDFTRLPLERGKRAEREAEPQVLSDLCAFFRERPEFEAVQAIAFPVTNKDPITQLDAKAGDLCRDGKFVEAKEPLQQKVALLTEKKGEKHFEVSDAKRSVKTIEQIAALTKEARAAWVESYEVNDEMGRLVKKGRFLDALPLAKRVWELRWGVLGREHETAAVAEVGYAQLLHYSGQYAKAEQLFREARGIIQRLVGDNHPGMGKVTGDLAMNLDAQDKYDESGPLYEAALEISRKNYGEHSKDTAISMNNLASHYDRQARFAESEPLYRKALDILLRAEGEDSQRVAINRHNLAYCLSEQAKFAEAEGLYRDVLRARRKLLGDDHADTAMTLSNLAVNLDEQGRHGQAEPLYHQALDINRKVFGEENTKTAISLNNLAMNLQHQRKYEEANLYFKKALEIHLKAVPGGSRNAAGVHHNLAANLQGQGQFDAAREQLEKSLEILRKLLGDSHPDVAQDYIGMASLLSDQGKYDQAKPLVRKAADLMKAALGPEHPRTIQAQISLANNLHNQERYSDAEAVLKDALEAQRRVGGEGNPTTTWAHLNRISNLWAQGKYREIEEIGPAAAASFEAVRPRLSSAGLDRAGRAVELSPLLTYLAAAAAHNKHPMAAWQYLESRLARGLFDDLSAKPLTEAERERERTIFSQLSRLNQQIASQTDRSEADKLRTRRDEAQGRLAELRAELAAKYGVPAGKPYDLPNIQKHLPPDTALVGWIDEAGSPKFHDPHGAHWVCVVRHQGDPVCVPLDGSSAGHWGPEDEALAAKVRNVLSERTDASKETWKDLVQKLYAQRLVPIESHLGKHDGLPEVRHLIVLPANVMAGIPIEALTHRYTVSYVPSGTTFAWLKNRHNEIAAGGAQGNKSSLLAVGDPNFQPSKTAKESPATTAKPQTAFPSLPGTGKEIQAIARLFPRAVLLKETEASEQNLQHMAEAGELRKFRFLHFATHGLLDDRLALNSALILAQDNLPDPSAQTLDGKTAVDGRLTADEILRNWQLDADLVTLSACETALGKFSGGESYVGFSQALFLAGARGMVLSLWRVDDRATALLMTRFYENMLGTPEGNVAQLPKTQALAEAKQWLRGLSALEVERLTADLPKGLPAGTRGIRREVPQTTDAGETPHPFEHPYYWSAFILIGDPS